MTAAAVRRRRRRRRPGRRADRRQSVAVSDGGTHVGERHGRQQLMLAAVPGVGEPVTDHLFGHRSGPWIAQRDVESPGDDVSVPSAAIIASRAASESGFTTGGERGAYPRSGCPGCRRPRRGSARMRCPSSQHRHVHPFEKLAKQRQSPLSGWPCLPPSGAAGIPAPQPLASTAPVRRRGQRLELR